MMQIESASPQLLRNPHMPSQTQSCVFGMAFNFAGVIFFITFVLHHTQLHHEPDTRQYS